MRRYRSDIPNIIFYNITKNKETKQYVYYRINKHKIGRRHTRMATATIPLKGSASMESKKVSISSKRQITIPQKFFTLLGFNTEAECIMRGNELVLRPVKENTSGEFAEQILADLIRQGYSGEELLEKFKQTQRKIRPPAASGSPGRSAHPACSRKKPPTAGRYPPRTGR